MMLVFVFPLAFFAGCSRPESVRITDAWVREPLPGRTVTAAFMTLENPTGEEIGLMGIETALSDMVELHVMEYTGEMMTMKRVDRIMIPAHEKTELKPGGPHVMLFELKRSPVAGDSVLLTAQLSNQTRVTVTARIRAYTAMR
ncbi:MAG: copper chaperone PCu(A)C [candidate division Zixibacteria bacterium]|nr:copper chaperone PCu(A)C [candidate division Zixibacteria bacterium]